MTRVLLVLLTLALAGGVARAQPARKKAEKLFDEGTRLYKAGDYDEAVARFRAGFELSEDPIFVFNIAVALRKKGDCAGALDSYQEYLRLSPKAPDRAKVEERVAEMKACVERQKTADAPEPAPDPTPSPSPSPSPSTLTSPSPSPSTLTSPSPATSTRGGRSLTLPLLVGGTGVVAAGVGGFLLWTARSKYNDLVDSGCKPSCDPDDWEGYDTRTTAGNVLLIGGGVLIAGGALLYFLQDPDPEPADETATRLLVGPGHVALTGRF